MVDPSKEKLHSRNFSSSSLILWGSFSNKNIMEVLLKEPRTMNASALCLSGFNSTLWAHDEPDQQVQECWSGSVVFGRVSLHHLGHQLPGLHWRETFIFQKLCLHEFRSWLRVCLTKRSCDWFHYITGLLKLWKAFEAYDSVTMLWCNPVIKYMY